MSKKLPSISQEDIDEFGLMSPVDSNEISTTNTEPLNKLKQASEKAAGFGDYVRETLSDAAISGAEGLSLGLSDEIGGALAAAPTAAAESWKYIKDKFGLKGEKADIEKVIKEYREQQQANQARQELASQRSPTASTIANIGGNVAGMIGTGGYGLVGKLGTKGSLALLAKEAGKRALVGGTVGATGGGAYGLSQSDGTLSDSLIKTGLGALGGGITGVTLAAPKLGLKAAEMALKDGINFLPMGAVQGAAMSKGKLIGATPEEQEQFLKDAGIGAATAGVLSAAGSLAGSALTTGKEVLKYNPKSDSPSSRAITKGIDEGYESGKSGEAGLFGDANQMRIIKEGKQVSQDISNKFETARKEMGEQLGQAVGNEPIIFNLGTNPELNPSLKLVSNFKNNKEMLMDSIKGVKDVNRNKVVELLQKIDSGNATTKDAFELKTLIDESMNANYVMGDPVPVLLQDMKKNLNSIIEKFSPEYYTKSQEFNQLAKATSDMAQRGSIGEIKNAKGDVVNQVMGFDQTDIVKNIKKMVETLNQEGTSNPKSLEAFDNLISGIKSIENNPQAKNLQDILKKSGIDSESISNQIKSHADLVAAREQAHGAGIVNLFKANSAYGVAGGLKAGVATPIGYAMGKGTGAITRQLSGKGNNILSKSIGWGKDNFMKFADSLETIPGMEQLAQRLRQGASGGDPAINNQVLFILEQKRQSNPRIQEAIDNAE
jgi:rubrerythrin